MSTIKIAIFESEEQVSNHWNGLADAVENVALPKAKITLYNAMKGIGRDSFLMANCLQNASDEVKDEAWQGHIEWCGKEVKYLESKIKHYRKMAVRG